MTLWDCPECAFAFDAQHVDTATGGYSSCPTVAALTEDPT